MNPRATKVQQLQEKFAEESRKLQAAIVQGFPQQRLADSLDAIGRALVEARKAAAR